MAKARTRARRGRPSRNGANGGDAAGRLLDAAEALLAERGFDGVSVRDVSERAGVNKALVFYYYKSKAGLFDAVLERYYRAHMEALSGALLEEQGRSERMHGLLDAYLDFMEHNHRYARLVQQEVARSGGHLDRIRENMAALLGWTERALGEVTPARGPLAAKHFFLSFSGMVISYYTLAPVLRTLWGEDPLGEPARRERRVHLHFMLDALLEKLP